MKQINLLVCIPSGRDINSIRKILELLSVSNIKISLVISRWANSPFSQTEIKQLQRYYPTKQVLSNIKYPPSMRNSIINTVEGGYILFLDDDIIPNSNLIDECIKLINFHPDCIFQFFNIHLKKNMH